jgi:hypothetical protein
MSQAMRVLVSEGSSLSAREIITALGLAGHKVGVCDPNSICLGRFSRFVSRFYRCPAVGKDPWAYLDAVTEILSGGGWDVLLPAHEQAFLFARERARIPPAVGLAVADFGSFLQLQGKAALVRTLARLCVPQPASLVIRTREELETGRRYRFYLKANYTTASKSVWRIGNSAEMNSRSAGLRAQGRLEGGEEFVVQECAEGALERVLTVFDRGELAGIHCYRQLLAGPGGGDIAKLGVVRPAVRRHLERLGAELRWHGALSMDYVLGENGEPLFIDANPRLVEPMNAVLSGVNLADMLVRISTGQTAAAESRPPRQVKTHLLLMALLGAADARQRRLDVAREIFRAVAGRGVYEQSQEELLPIGTDFKCLIPLMYAAARLFVSPGSSSSLSAGSIASYSLSPGAARQIADLSGA